MIELTISAVRSYSGAFTDNFIYIIDPGKEGMWKYDATDTTSADNTGSVLVTADAKRVKRIIDWCVNAAWFNAKGDGVTDDTLALINALEAAVKYADGNLYIPRTSGNYMITSTIYNRMGSGNRINITSNGATIKTVGNPTNNTIWNLTPVREHVILSLGQLGQGTNVLTAFDNNIGTEVYVEGLVIDCSSLTQITDPVNNNVDIGIGIQINAEKTAVRGTIVQNTIGYGIRVHGARIADISDCDMLKVGLRDKNGTSPNYTGADSYGDGLYFTGNKPDARITIEGVKCLSIDNVSKRGRSAITFEFSNLSNAQVAIRNCIFDYYAQCLHIETQTLYKISFDNCTFSRYNILASVALSNSTILYTNCMINIADPDGYDQVGAPYFVVVYHNLPKLDFINCVISNNGTLFDRISGLTGIENFISCVFNMNSMRLAFADSGKNTLFTNCTFNDFGSNTGTSAFTNYTANSSSYTLMNCNFAGNNLLRVANTDGKAHVTLYNCRHATNQQLLVANNTPVIDSIMPFDSNMVTKTRIAITGSFVIIGPNNTGSPLWDAMRFSAIVIGADSATSIRDINRSLMLAGGYWLVDFNWVPQGWHQAYSTLVGTEPAGFSIVTSNGGVTWSPNTTGGNLVKEVVVLYFPKHMKSYFM
jgi:hypothetical protein